MAITAGTRDIGPAHLIPAPYGWCRIMTVSGSLPATGTVTAAVWSTTIVGTGTAITAMITTIMTATGTELLPGSGSL